MKVITLNANGIRAALKKGLLDWLKKENADFICLQETKLQMKEVVDAYQIEGYHLFHHDALKPGYSGVAIYSKHKPKKVIVGLGFPIADDEGRHIRLDIDNFSIISIYLPSGSSSEARQQVKFEFMKFYEPYLKKLIKSGRDVIICGDWNIVHQRIDIKNWSGNQKHSGCLPEERAWLHYLLTKVNWVDAFRMLNQEADQYTWWSQRGQARAKNVGWRIDYQMVTPSLGDKIKSVSIYKETKLSDHAPVIVEYDYTI